MVRPGKFAERGGTYMTILHAGEIPANTDHNLTPKERGNAPIDTILSAVKISLFADSPPQASVTELNVVTTTPDATNEIQLVDYNTIRVYTAHTTSDLLLMFVRIAPTDFTGKGAEA